MAERLFNLPETKGVFNLKGIVTGTEKDNFYKEIKTKNGKNMKIVNFGVTYSPNSTIYVNLQGMERDNVYFYKNGDKKTGTKGETVKVAWANRFNFNKEGYKLIGVNVGVKKKLDEKANSVNDKKMLAEFDACEEIRSNLHDDSSVFIKGSMDYSSYTDDKGNIRRSIKLVPNQVSLCGDVDFKSDTFVQQNDFNQVIIFTGIDQEKNNDSPTGRYVLSAKIVTYNSIEDVEFIVENSALANKMRKNLKPYNAIRVSGHMVAYIPVEDVEDDDEWGEEDAITKVKANAKREFVVTGAKGSTLDRDTYTEQNVSEAIAKIKKSKKAESDFGDDNSEWGDTSSLDEADDEEAWD